MIDLAFKFRFLFSFLGRSLVDLILHFMMMKAAKYNDANELSKTAEIKNFS